MSAALRVLLATLAVLTLPSRAVAEDISWVWHSASAPPDAQHLALLLDHFEFSADATVLRPRARPLVPGKGVRVTPVVHAQIAASAPATVPDVRQTDALVRAVRAAAARSGSGWVQLDFEVARSRREYFLALVQRLRHELPAAVRLSVTVQAHWCEAPDLMARIAADEIVPMFFHTGDDTTVWWRRLRAGTGLSPRCLQGAAGFAVQEPPPPGLLSAYDRRYWFSYRNWTSH